MSDALLALRLLVNEQRRKGIPQDEMLCPPELADRVLLELGPSLAYWDPTRTAEILAEELGMEIASAYRIQSAGWLATSLRPRADS